MAVINITDIADQHGEGCEFIGDDLKGFLGAAVAYRVCLDAVVLSPTLKEESAVGSGVASRVIRGVGAVSTYR